MSKLKTLTPYYGGKFNKVGKFIAEILPAHRNYIETCGGMAGVMMQKSPSFVEVYNDIDGHLVNLFQVVRCPKLSRQLEEKLWLTPFARDEWKYCQRNFKTETDPVEKARMTYVTLSMGFLGSLGNKSWSYGGTRYESSTARTFFNGLKSLPVIHRRIKNLVIENQDCLEVAKKWDSKDSCIYFDFPYLKETRVTFNDYAHEMTYEQHENALDFIISAKSKVLVSGYLSDLYVSVLEPQFKRIEIDTFSRGAKSNGRGYESKRTECIWVNYDAKDLSNPLFEPRFTATPTPLILN